MPGPGVYNIIKDLVEKHGIRFGSEKRQGMEEKRKVPGPGAYNASDAAGKIDKIRIVKFGSSLRDPAKKSFDTPGPGAYPVKNKIGSEGRKFTLSGRPKTSEKLRAQFPGPAAYNPMSEYMINKSKHGFR